MKRWIRRVLLGLGALAGVAIISAALTFGPGVYRVVIGLHRYEFTAPELPQLNDPAILVFSKTNGYRHDDAIDAAKSAISDIAKRRGWSILLTENGAVFNPEQLHRFKAVVWNNVSGDVLTLDQQTAFRRYLETGGGFVGIHGAGGDLRYRWRWYVDTLIGAQFIGHTLAPQFPQATIHVEDATNPATRGLGATWTRTDEWYSFAKSPRTLGYHILATLDETSYSPVMALPWRKYDIRMGDHPIIWLHCVENGRAFYSALGHQALAYAEPEHVGLLEGAISWAAGLDGSRCLNGVEVAR